jgi:hypothetical protein
MVLINIYEGGLMNYKKGIAVNRVDFRRLESGYLPGVVHGRDLLPKATQKVLTIPRKTWIGGVRVRRFKAGGIEIVPRLRVDLTRGL